MTTESTTSAAPTPMTAAERNAEHYRGCMERANEERRKLADELAVVKEAMRTTAKGAVIVDGGILLRMLLSTALLPADNACLGQARVLIKKITPVPVRVEIAGGAVSIGDPAGKWSRSFASCATEERAAPVEVVPALPVEVPAPEVADKELCDLCTELAGRPLSTRAACLAWLRELAEGRKVAKESATAALRLVYSAPREPGLRQLPAAARRRVPVAKGKGKVAAKVAERRRRRPVADEWDW